MAARSASSATHALHAPLTSSADPVWARVLDAIANQVGARDLRSLVEHSRFLRRDGAHLPAAIRQDLVEAWRRDGRLHLLCAAVADVDGKNAGPALAITPVRADELRAPSPHRRLDDIVVSPANRDSHDAVTEVARGRNQTALLVGPAASGKTHLLHGLAESARDALFVRADDLTAELLRGVQDQRLEAVRQRLRSTDLLLVDGLERLDGRAGSQNELADAIHHIGEHGGSVVLASQRPVGDLGRLRPEFRAVLESAPESRLRPPGRPTRVDIVRRRLSRWGVDTVPEAASWLSSELAENLAPLDALLTRVLAHPTCLEGVVDPDRHRRELSSGPSGKRAPLPVAAVLDPVCRHFNLRLADLLGPGRSPRVTQPRQVAMYLLRRYSSLSYPEIGQRLRRHHTTALHACRRIVERRAEDSSLATALGLLEKELDHTSELRGERPG